MAEWSPRSVRPPSWPGQPIPRRLASPRSSRTDPRRLCVRLSFLPTGWSMCVESRSQPLPQRPRKPLGQHFLSIDRRQTLLLSAVASIGELDHIVKCRYGGVNRMYSSCEQRCSCGPRRRKYVLYVYTGHLDTWGPSQDLLGTFPGSCQILMSLETPGWERG